jgi:hypothetical protein
MSLTASIGTAQGQTAASGELVGWATNGPAVFHVRRLGATIQPGAPVTYAPLPDDLTPEIRRTMTMFRATAHAKVYLNTTRIFDHFLPESLNYLVLTNFIAHTNGRNMLVWSLLQHPADWPAHPLQVTWNTASLMWGMKGLTALSPCWELEGNPGQVPITALTRRHGYTRGHDMGPDAVGNRFAGRKVWFVTTDNRVVQTTVAREVVRTAVPSGRDYTIVLFNSDLPNTIQPMRVVRPEDVFSVPRTKYLAFPDALCPLFGTEQGGHVSANVPGFSLDIVKGGDSGSPNMLPLPGELVFWTGRTTSGASPQMQADMDNLCRLEGLDLSKYQLQWVNLDAYPTYTP